MCGLSGIINKINAVERKDITAMNDLIAHRGPDDDGFYFGQNFAFGHRRLAIIDLSKNAHQPMKYKDKYVLIFNGEIYNFIEIKKILIGKGYTFKSKSDSEVILASYDYWGTNCISKFNGMWSFALFDKEKNIIFCSRDRFGIKPFYYFNNQKIFLFGSEIRQILHFFESVKANKKTIIEFLFANKVESYEMTFFKDVFKLPGGHNLIYNLNNHEYEVSRYYELKKSKNMENMTLDNLVQTYGDYFDNSVNLRLRSDVPVGICLSGGLDSSSIATLAASKYDNNENSFKAITAVSKDVTRDESVFAEKVVKHSEIKWIKVKPTYDMFSKYLSEVVRAQEEPFQSPSIIMQFFVMMKAKKEKIPVLLDGQGGDETLLGYDRYHAIYFFNLLKLKGFRGAYGYIKKIIENNKNLSIKKLIFYLIYFRFGTIRYFRYLYRNRYLKYAMSYTSFMKNKIKNNNLSDLQINEIIFDNLPPLLRYEDKNSMWFSIETRLPFIDYLTLETAISLPVNSKLNNGWSKYILRKYMDGKMPNEITWRKNKYGFEAPDRLWINKHNKKMQRTILNSKLIQNICRVDFLSARYNKVDLLSKWKLYNLALWEKEFNVKLF